MKFPEIWQAFGRFDARLQQSVISVVVALDGAGNLREVPLALRPTDPAAFGFSVSGFTIEDGRDNVRRWAFRNAFSNCVEDFAIFVEEAVAILTGATGQADRAKFNRRLFHEKLDALRVAIGPSNTIRHLDCVDSINRTRNCLVHRAGVVGPADVKGAADQRLALSYAKHHLKKLPDNTPPMPGMVIHDDSLAVLARSVESLSFPVGATVDLSVDAVTHSLVTARDVAMRVAGIASLLDHQARP